jgi:hypothetical protein
MADILMITASLDRGDRRTAQSAFFSLPHFSLQRVP